MGHPDHITNSASLVEYFATVLNPRNRRGRRYEWVYLLTLIVTAMMMGEGTLGAKVSTSNI